MSWNETLGQVMQTRLILAYGASYMGAVVATARPVHPGQHSSAYRLRGQLRRPIPGLSCVSVLGRYSLPFDGGGLG